MRLTYFVDWVKLSEFQLYQDVCRREPLRIPLAGIGGLIHQSSVNVLNFANRTCNLLLKNR